MSVFDDLPVREALEGTWRGTVATAPDSQSLIHVTIPAFDETFRFGPCRWIAKGNSTPSRGDECVVIFDEQQRPVALVWDTDAGTAGAEYDVGASTGGDDRAMIQEVIDNAEADKATVRFRGDQYIAGSPGLTVESEAVALRGAGRDATILRKNGNYDLLTFKGPGTFNHIKRCALSGMTLHGNDSNTGSLLTLVYTGEFLCDDMYFWGCPDVAVKTAEFWDSKFESCYTVWCSGNDGTKPAWYLRNSFASSGFGSSTDNTNMIRIVDCHWETFKDGAVWVKAGVSNTNNPNGIWFERCKFETIQSRGPFVENDGFTRNFHMSDCYFSLGGLDSGYSSLPYLLGWYSAQLASLTNIHFHQFGGTYDRFIDWWPAGGPNTWTTLGFQASNAPTTACIKFSGGTSVELARRNVKSLSGHTLTSGTIPPSPTDF